MKIDRYKPDAPPEYKLTLTLEEAKVLVMGLMEVSYNVPVEQLTLDRRERYFKSWAKELSRLLPSE